MSANVRIPYGPRRCELEAMAVKHNAGRRGKKYPVDFGEMNRAQLMTALRVKIEPFMQEPG